MDIYLNGSYFNAKEVHFATFNYRPEKKTTTTGYLWWKKTKEEDISKWEIYVEYLNADGNNKAFKSSSPDKQVMLDDFKSLIEQIKIYGNQWADKALEEAILNSGKA